MNPLSMESYDQDNMIVTFNVLVDINIGNYVLQDTTFDQDDIISNRQPHQVAFPSCMLKAGQLLRVHLIKHNDADGQTFGGLYETPARLGGRPIVGGAKPVLIGLQVYAGWSHAINKTGDTLTLLKKIEQFDLPPDE